jgi:hypothetical protein
VFAENGRYGAEGESSGSSGRCGKTEKWCPGCQRMLPFAAFRQQFTTSTWLSSWCRACLIESTRAWREKHRDEYNARWRVQPPRLRCVECGVEFEGPQGQTDPLETLQRPPLCAVASGRATREAAAKVRAPQSSLTLLRVFLREKKPRGSLAGEAAAEVSATQSTDPRGRLRAVENAPSLTHRRERTEAARLVTARLRCARG